MSTYQSYLRAAGLTTFATRDILEQMQLATALGFPFGLPPRQIVGATQAAFAASKSFLRVGGRKTGGGSGGVLIRSVCNPFATVQTLDLGFSDGTPPTGTSVRADNLGGRSFDRLLGGGDTFNEPGQAVECSHGLSAGGLIAGGRIGSIILPPSVDIDLGIWVPPSEAFIFQTPNVNSALSLTIILESMPFVIEPIP